MKTLDGKIILVTGGARGLGEAICRELSAAGAQVILMRICAWTWPNKSPTKSTSRAARSLPWSWMSPMKTRSSTAVDQIQAQYGRLDVLINSAGIDKTVSIEELEVEDWDRIMAVNLRAPFILAKYALPIMRQQGSGYIINICSTAAKRAWPNASAYHASKWGLLGFSHALLTEARPHNIKVTALDPGWDAHPVPARPLPGPRPE